MIKNNKKDKIYYFQALLALLMSKLKIIIYLLAVFLLLLGGFLIYVVYNNLSYAVDSDDGDGQNSEVVGELTARYLDGVLVENGSENLLPVAVMIENYITSRPTDSLSSALVVYEVLSESYITRFLAIYDGSQSLNKIGPVRSARSYYVDLASEYQAVYAHSGGSPDSLDRLRSEKNVFDLNEFYYFSYFWRDKDRRAPHNLYTSSDLLDLAVSNYELSLEGSFESWQFKDDDDFDEADRIESIRIDYSGSYLDHRVVWVYSEDTGDYYRWQSDSPHLDVDGTQIKAKNIIIQFATHRVVDSVGRREIDLNTGGEAVVLLDGIKTTGYWKKENNRTKFYDNSDQEIKFNRGSVWVQLVPVDMEIKFD